MNAAQVGSVVRSLPGLTTLRALRIALLCHDLMAGLVLTTMLVPVGIAYAVASGLPGDSMASTPPLFPLLAYAVFGPSRILVLGPDFSLAPIILAIVLVHSGGHPHACDRARGHYGHCLGSILRPRRFPEASGSSPSFCPSPSATAT